MILKKSLKLEILEYNYWEHFKTSKDLALILPIDNPRRKEVEEEINKYSSKYTKLKKINKLPK